jgi:hypothetical protein
MDLNIHLVYNNYGMIFMQIDVDCLNESVNGWKVRIKVTLPNEEFSQFDQDLIRNIEDFQIDVKGHTLYFSSFLSIAEPWEDEPLEELIKSIKLEVEYHMKKVLGE